MSKEPQQVSFQDYITIKRNQVIIAYDNAKETALRSIDDLAGKLLEQMQLVEAFKSKESNTPPEKTKK